jgi:hypothetical protein
VTVNLAAIAGRSGMYVAQASWLPAIYIAFNASTNVMLVGAQAQVGMRSSWHCSNWGRSTMGLGNVRVCRGFLTRSSRRCGRP